MRRFTAGHHYGSRDSLFWRCAPRISPLNSLLASVVRNLTKVEMPALSPTMSSGTIVSWKKKIGDPIAPGDVFCEVQTDKATLDYENVADEGFLARILKKEGADPVKVGEIIALLVENESELNSDEVTKFKSEIDIQPKETKDAVVNDQPTQTNQSLPRENTPVPVSPYARTLAKELNIDPTTLKPSGGVGSTKRVTSDDVRRYAASCENNSLQKVAAVSKTLDTQNPSNTAHPKVAKSSIQEKLVSASGSINTKYEDIPLTSMRRIIAARLHQSKNIEVPHYYISMDISVQSAMQVIAHLRQKTQQKISINDYIIRVVAKASMVIPEARTHFITGSDVNTYNGSDTFLRKYNSVDVSVAVATEGGLLTPIVRDADRKGIAEISSEVKALAAKAREGTLRPEEYQGGTISVSNLGPMGVHHFTAIINPPQSVILAVGTTRYRHRITSQPPTGTVEPALATLGKPMYLSNEAEPYITCTASFDHRVIDGAIGAKWMQQVQEYIENPLSLLA